jgi:hypothetical protein
MARSASYFAGLFDGEGCVITFIGRRGRYCQIYPKVTMVAKAPVEALYETYGGYFRRLRGQRSNTSRKATRRQWLWSAYSADARRFFKSIKPFSLCKHAEIVAAIQLLDLMGRPGGPSPSKMNIAKRIRLVAKIRALKRLER